MVFKVTVNPFTRECEIVVKVNHCTHTIDMSYQDIDEWNSFEVGGKVFDIHFLYDADFTVSIYPVTDNKVDWFKPYKVKLTIKLTD